MQASKLRILILIVILFQNLFCWAQDEDRPGLSRRSFLRGMLSAGAAATVISPTAVLAGALEGSAATELGKAEIIDIMKDIFTRNSNARRIVDIENYLSEMRALARAAGPHMRQIILGEVARVEGHIARMGEIQNLGNVPGSSLSRLEIEKLQEEVKTPNAQEILRQLHPTNLEYNMFVVRSMLPPDLIRTINHGLAFSGNLGDFLGFSELQLVYDYGKIMAALQSKAEPGSRIHVMADSFLEMFDVSEHNGIPGIREAPSMTCRRVFGF